jgi:hypothetical protein
VTQQQRVKILAELDDAYESIKLELERTKQNLYGNSDKLQLNLRDRKSLLDTITCEEILLTQLNDKVINFRHLTSMASEVFLLSTKHRYNNKTSSFAAGSDQ